jgi:hypothetical protein
MGGKDFNFWLNIVINIHSMNWLLMTTILTAIGVEMGGKICHSFLRFVTHFLVGGFWSKLGGRLGAGLILNFSKIED